MISKAKALNLRCPEIASKSVSQSTDNRSANQDTLKV